MSNVLPNVSDIETDDDCDRVASVQRGALRDGSDQKGQKGQVIKVPFGNEAGPARKKPDQDQSAASGSRELLPGLNGGKKGPKAWCL